ncbi:MAG: hypothetical protein LQ338_006180 [Usnochroma carphineum]|nr:MAG: hypothetical protein LQ338_006180 [Usnochroma carphineum]
MYYASRTLPNFFAFGLVTVALAKLLPQVQSSSRLHTSDTRTFLTLLTITGIIFRSELALLLIPHTLLILLRRQLSLPMIITSGLLGALVGLSLTVPIDSLFWQRFPLWPELSAFSYNILHSQSSNWGTSPWHFYFSSAIPRLLFNPLTYILCIPFSLAQPALRRPAAELILPNLAFVALYSFQPHKEWRFIIYVIPPLLTAAAMSANWIWTRRSKTLIYRILSLALVGSVFASFTASTFMLSLSRLNYPGAEALNRLHAIAPSYHAPSEVVHVHMDTLSCMTGVTRFLQLPPPPSPSPLFPPPSPSPSSFSSPSASPREQAANETDNRLFYIYDKSENETLLLDPIFWERFQWVLAERAERVIGRWEVVDTVDAYAGVRVVRPGDSEGGDGGELGGGKGGERSGVWAMLREGEWKGVVDVVERCGCRFTGGWWIRVVMEPKIRILKREREVVGLGMGGDW